MGRGDRIDTQSGAAREAAEEIFVLCFPPVLIDTIRRAHPLPAHPFQILGEHGQTLAPGLAGDDIRVVVSSAFFNLAHAPAVLRLPNTHGRHFTLTLIDAVGEPFAGIGSRTGADAGVDLILAGPHWTGSPPAGMTVKRSPSTLVWGVSRVHANSTLDYAEAAAAAQRLRVGSLGGFHEGDEARPSYLTPPSSPCVRQALAISPGMFFHRLDALLGRAPIAFQHDRAPRVSALLETLGGPPDPTKWSADFAQAVSLGFADGVVRITTAAEIVRDGEGPGWRTGNGASAGAASTALERAARAFIHTGAPLAEDVLSLTCERDSAERPLSGAGLYRIHFSKDGLPPVAAFWWLSAHPTAPQDHRHGIGDRCELALNADGSLDLLIQHLPPRVTQASNWLPAPESGFSLTMNLYWPRPGALQGVWRMPPVQRLDSPVERD